MEFSQRLKPGFWLSQDGKTPLRVDKVATSGCKRVYSVCEFRNETRVDVVHVHVDEESYELVQIPRDETLMPATYLGETRWHAITATTERFINVEQLYRSIEAAVRLNLTVNLFKPGSENLLKVRVLAAELGMVFLTTRELEKLQNDDNGLRVIDFREAHLLLFTTPANAQVVLGNADPLRNIAPSVSMDLRGVTTEYDAWATYVTSILGHATHGFIFSQWNMYWDGIRDGRLHDITSTYLPAKYEKGLKCP